MTGRTVSWSSDNPNAAIPRHVQARIVLRQKGLCALTGARLKPGHFDFDHERPLSMGGAHAESNLRAVAREAHRAKTAEEAGPRAKADRIRMKHLGLKPKGRGWGNRNRKLNGKIGLTKKAEREAGLANAGAERRSERVTQDYKDIEG